ncbi:non-hydrolyzing UDP-N-acetylglucosamine 2-epimerase [Thermodesulfovibrio yellowstonii]|uniref:UDP-N-acetylglucosamine 2-epimerase (non-hydrolyzing) n=1 Tax=Thermodesulfovibrio yellowstonii (strain ATCC 51303 / DSM 11347 / YP87) TaxID=289376 RepID=B5YJC9_THEYD|nr:UDP-N-acetylglucosamine 2-epimerase (non-hydrolyzing) [Thermodesulfovibrio yellowstonii]ACI22156.1 UDP-N-acetylglucosamine 2-epimerase [Thermodesulfovibrio yellowstonii DSM 11347]
MRKILMIFGTRPEAIKMAPLYWEFKKYQEDFDVKVCVTAQHRQMLDQVLNFFNIKPDYDLNLMRNNQSLFNITSDSIVELEKVYDDFNPHIVLVQGDTTTSFTSALSAYYKKIKVAHIEAGLRSGNKYSPFPEEINRVLVGHIADYHFAPTEKAKQNLYNEGIRENVWVVGNTVIDALFLGLRILEENEELRSKIELYFNGIFEFQREKIILVTGHRRESFGEGFENICNALKEIAESYPELKIIYPVHLNPNVREPVNRILNGIKNIFLLEPLEYPYLIWLMSKSFLILTDSGGIQEEAPSLGKPVLVMREVTERVEGIEAGTASLVGIKKENIVKAVQSLIENTSEYHKMARAINPYGDGLSSKRIVEIIRSI